MQLKAQVHTLQVKKKEITVCEQNDKRQQGNSHVRSECENLRKGRLKHNKSSSNSFQHRRYRCVENSFSSFAWRKTGRWSKLVSTKCPSESVHFLMVNRKFKRHFCSCRVKWILRMFIWTLANFCHPLRLSTTSFSSANSRLELYPVSLTRELLCTKIRDFSKNYLKILKVFC